MMVMVEIREVKVNRPHVRFLFLTPAEAAEARR
jgi:hypothetical protein